jgi:3-deoxy-D-manno-octulosonate 8-phosphate phosphatase (KDO 8-P phosphatase)
MPSANSFPPAMLERASKIKLLLMDCDGVLTDGRIYLLVGPDGHLFETKTFHTKDGIALAWAYAAGIETGIISGRKSPAVEERARTAHMRYLFQGNTTKLPLFEEILNDSGLQPEQIAYMGDDLTDLPLMRRCGLAAAPADSQPEVLEAAHYVTPAKGGHGAVRAVIELLLVAQNRWEEVLAKYNL